MGMLCGEDAFKSQFNGVNTDAFVLNKAGGVPLTMRSILYPALRLLPVQSSMQLIPLSLFMRHLSSKGGISV